MELKNKPITEWKDSELLNSRNYEYIFLITEIHPALGVIGGGEEGKKLLKEFRKALGKWIIYGYASKDINPYEFAEEFSSKDYIFNWYAVGEPAHLKGWFFLVIQKIEDKKVIKLAFPPHTKNFLHELANVKEKEARFIFIPFPFSERKKWALWASAITYTYDPISLKELLQKIEGGKQGENEKMSLL